ncbi:hypothetical protein [Curtobacterium sp. MCJR17_020]|uniref:hypothetical protein n=1 Tax=Curtobacterium sp. MCJR17_020 TaxID=2175619 RepID=UPI0011B6B488|nr:hypothetical protein [Curtobacterium sp. MCJR17_020]WIE73402.1 hypothetical protein DEJ14_006420 [Curtobacterium sp. MCJR17_020]
MSTTTTTDARHGGRRRIGPVAIDGPRLAGWAVMFVVVQAVASAWQVSATQPGVPDSEFDFQSHPTWWLVAITGAAAVIGWQLSERLDPSARFGPQAVLRWTVRVMAAMTVLVVVALPAQMLWVVWAVHHGVLDPITLPNVVRTVRQF